MDRVSSNGDWRLIVDAPMDAAANMARDEALLASAAGGRTTLRFYAWRPRAFSLGYFQSWGDFAAHADGGRAVVRRLTGGGAIWHADEITYSLAGPFAVAPFPRRAAGIFEKVHRAVADGLSRLGVAAALSDAPTGRSANICFERPQKYDIVVGARKLLGSAQRRVGKAFLQHGSLPLSPNEFAPSALSLWDLLPERPPDSAVIDALAAAFERHFGARLVRGALDAAELGQAQRLAVEKYSSQAWNRRR